MERVLGMRAGEIFRLGAISFLKTPVRRAGEKLKLRQSCSEMYRRALRLGKLQVAPRFWRKVCKLAEKSSEVTLVFKARAQADFHDGQTIVGQELLGAFDAPFHQIMLRREAGRFSKGAGEMKLAQARDRGQLNKAKIVIEVFVNKLFNPAQFVTR